MASVNDLIVTIGVDLTAWEQGLQRVQADLTTMLRRRYIAEGCPNGHTPEGFDAWLAEREALLVASIESVEAFDREIAHFDPKIMQAGDGILFGSLARQFDRLRKGPPGSTDDCEFCHPEAETKE